MWSNQAQNQRNLRIILWNAMQSTTLSNSFLLVFDFHDQQAQLQLHPFPSNPVERRVSHAQSCHQMLLAIRSIAPIPSNPIRLLHDII